MFNYLTALPVVLKMILSVGVIISATTVLVTINRSQRNTQTQHFFFIANVMLANIVAAIARSVIAYTAALKIAHPSINTIRCKVFGEGTVPVVASFSMVVALCLDRMFTVMAPNMYKKIMIKSFAIAIAAMVWNISFMVTYNWLFDHDLADLQDGTCNTGYFEQFEIRAIVYPMVTSGVLAVIHNIFIFYKVFITTAFDARLSAWPRFARFRKAWRIYKETQSVSITLLVLGGYNIATSITIITVGLVQSYAGGFIQHALMSFCAYVIDASMLVESLLYIQFLHTIKEHLWFKCRRQ